MKTKKVSFIITDMSSGGAERVMSLIANYFDKQGIETQILAIKSNRMEYSLNKNVKFNFIGTSSNPLMRFFIRLYNIRKETRDSDVVIAFLWHCNVYTILATMFSGKKIIISERSDPNKEMRGKFRFLKWFRNMCYHVVDTIIFQTLDAMNYYRGKLYNKGTVIPNPISPNLPKVYNGIRKKRLVAVGRLTEQKNMPVMIEAFARIHKEFPEYTLTIYGEGELKEKLIQQVEKLFLTHAVDFAGFKNNILYEIADAKIFLTSSNFEGISNSMLEGLAMGIPVVATDCPVGGARQFVKTGWNGELVPMNNVSAFENAIRKILVDDDYWKELSNNAINIRKELSIDSIGQEWVKLL